MRPVRRQLKFDEDSVNKLLQEIYDDSRNQKAKIVRLFTKWELKVKEGGEIQAIGDQIVKLIAAEAKNVDQKIMLLRYLKEVVFDDNVNASYNKNNNESSQEKGDINTEQRNDLLDLIQEEIEKKEKQKK
jgi:hypothetical protein